MHHIKRILKEFGHKLNSISSSEAFRDGIMSEYAAINERESAMSLQIFFSCPSNFTEIFKALSAVLGFHSNETLVFSVGRTIIAILNLSSFFSVAGFALGVSEEDEKARQKMEDISFGLNLPEETKKEGTLFYRFSKLTKKLILRARGAFSFIRGFLLTSIGVLLTYNFLFLQLDAYYDGNKDNQQSA
ncbi:hypothetical protein AVEN_220818-1 [Araneus ventricosus]|uniref:Uncharacterized protein n=1 Tax=Araneus ventricosus TaxID=182803 RepID=A0A4Y2FRV4_ARAVE|nr:hypothetical protein AVEN_220818-1 [Araneus ventricosus]